MQTPLSAAIRLPANYAIPVLVLYIEAAELFASSPIQTLNGNRTDERRRALLCIYSPQE